MTVQEVINALMQFEMTDEVVLESYPTGQLPISSVGESNKKRFVPGASVAFVSDRKAVIHFDPQP